MWVTWQAVLLRKEQSHVTLFSFPFASFVVQLPCPLQGSTLKSQLFFPSVFAISLRACTVNNKIKPFNHLYNYYLSSSAKSFLYMKACSILKLSKKRIILLQSLDNSYIYRFFFFFCGSFIRVSSSSVLTFNVNLHILHLLLR